MEWFKNLNATPRLMLSFGVVLLLTFVMGFLGLSRLSSANDRLVALYKLDLLGVVDIEDIVIQRTASGRFTRQAILDLDNPAAVAEDEKNVFSTFAAMRADLDDAKGLFYVKAGQAAMNTIREGLPGYEQAHHVIFERIKAHDLAGAKAALLVANALEGPIADAVARAQAMKRTLTQQKFDTSMESYRSARGEIVGVLAASLILGFLLSIFIARGFALPLGRAVAALELVGEGDLTIALEVLTSDEVGRMAGALNAALEKLRFTLVEVSDSAAHSSSSSRELAASAELIAGGAQAQAASLEETSASLEEITAAVRQSTDNARQASQLATGSRESAENGQQVVASAIGAMAEINTASAKISDIISTINEIAFQTNLLAVNAAVEAARAGEEGRGFAVVATEVRSLAQRSAGAAKEIKSLIQDSLHKVEKGSELVNLSGATLQGIVGSVKRVTDIVGEIAAAASEQSLGVGQVNTAVTQMDQVIQSNSAQTEQLSATAQSFAGESGGWHN